MLDKYKNSQPFAYQILMNEIKNDFHSHAYIIEANGFHDAMGFAISLAKTLFCVNCTDIENVVQLIDEGNFPELKIIDPEGLMIKKEEIDNLQLEFSKKPIYSDKKIYIINNAERLNLSAANSLLKFLEEPDQDIVAILVTNNIYEMLSTIISRCQIINLREELIDLQSFDLNKRILFTINKSEEEFQNIFEKENFDDEIVNVINFVNYYEKHKMDTFIYVNKMWFDYYKSKDQFDIAFQVMLLYYVDVLKFKCKTKINIFNDYQIDIEEICDQNEIAQIVNKIKVIMILNKNIKANNNLNLVMDKLLIEFGRCDFLV